jgi:RNA polymerase sigma-70 factor, ECF subfamily
MQPVPSGEITRLLQDLREGRPHAKEELAACVYGELHRIASRQMRHERADHTLQPTALVNEAYLHLVQQADRNWENRSHFFAVASQIMRRILVDHARKRGAAKRADGLRRVDLDDSRLFTAAPDEELLALDEALERLAALNQRHCQVVELRFFGGLTEEEIAAHMGLSSRTVKRYWTVARAWLYDELTSSSSQ